MIDMVPKAITLTLVNHSKENLQRELLQELYKPDVLEDLLKESELIVARRKEVVGMVQALNKAEECVPFSLSVSMPKRLLNLQDCGGCLSSRGSGSCHVFYYPSLSKCQFTLINTCAGQSFPPPPPRKEGLLESLPLPMLASVPPPPPPPQLAVNSVFLGLFYGKATPRVTVGGLPVTGIQNLSRHHLTRNCTPIMRATTIY